MYRRSSFLTIAASAHRKQVPMKTPSASTFPSTRAIARAIISFRSALLTSSPNFLTARSTSPRAISGKKTSAPTDSAAS